jgi:hypothetical protein
MQALIDAFEETKALQDVGARTTRRDTLVNEMCSAMLGLKNVDVDGIVKNVDRWGEVAAFLVTGLVKFQGSDCYNGPLLTMGRLRNILNFTEHPSKYLRHMARTLVIYFIQGNTLSDEEKSMVTEHMKRYNMDEQAGHSWAWEGLVALCPLSEDSFLGSMVGQCVGDALGFIVEGQALERCQQFVQEFVLKEKIPTWVRIKALTFGQYSDDSQLARETYVSVVQASGKLDPAVYGNRYMCAFCACV